MNMRRIVPMLVFLSMVIGLSTPALAIEPRVGDTVVIGRSISDDVYAAGQTVDVEAAIDGDLVACGRTVRVNAPVTGAVIACAQNIDLNDGVGRSIRAAAAYVSMRGSAGTDAILLAGDVAVADTARVGRDLVVAAGQVRMMGTIDRNATISGGTVTLGGTIAGNVRVDADALIVLSSARITGKLTYTASNDAEIQPGAQLTGGIERTARPEAPRRRARPLAGFRWWLGLVEFAFLFVLGAAALAFSTRGVLTVADRIGRRFGASLLTGFVLAIVVPVVVVLCFATVIGIPIGGVALLLYVATLYPAKVFTAAWVGDWAMNRLQPGNPNRSPYVEMLVGVLIIAVLISLPYVGWVLRAAAVLVGFGALWTQIWSAREGRTEPLG